MDANCKICGKQEIKHKGKPRINKGFPRFIVNEYEIFQCRNCGFYFVLPEIDLTQEEWKDLYENNYFLDNMAITEWGKDLHVKERRKRLEIIRSKLKINEDKFLDMGCGEGHVLREAQICGFESYGVDIANNVTPSNSGFKFFRGSIIEAKFPDDFFAAIYMDSVLEHVLTPMETLKELRRILKPGGVLFVIVPNEDSLVNRFTHLCRILTFTSRKYGKIKPFENPFHVNGFNPNSLKIALTISEFSDIVIEGFGGDYTNWRGDKFGTIQYFWHLVNYPVGLLSVLMNNQVQMMALAVK